MKVRIRFSKLGKVRFTSHRDVARIWERALRRASLPLTYTEGFAPRPKLSFGLALSTGHESLGEYLDVDLRHDVELEQLPALLDPVLPAGMAVQAVAPLERGTESLQQLVTSCTWRIELLGLDPADAFAAVERVLAAAEVLVTRERKGNEVTDDVRPAILSLAVVGPTDRGSELEAELATQPRGLRPAELVAALDLPPDVEGRVVRTHQWTLVDGARQEPLALPATSTTHAGARAS